MGHSNSFEDTKNIIDLDEVFGKCFNTDKLEAALNNALRDNPSPDQPKKESISNTIFRFIDNWYAKNPGLSLAIILGGSAFICYKMTVDMLSQAVFKGNLKTSRYFNKHAG